MIRLILINILFCHYLYALDCQKRLFDISINEKLSIQESLDELAKYCSFSIIVKDKIAKEKLEILQNSVNIHQMSLDEIFNFFIKEHDLSYDFDGKILRISGINTKIFKISYITSIREGQSITKASVDAKPRQSEYSGSFDDAEDNMIKSMEKFDFWQNIEKEIIVLLKNSHEDYEAKTPIINPNAGLIIVTGTNSQLKSVKNYLQKLENRLKKQVIIDVSILAVSLNESHSSGINWQNFNIGLNSQVNNENSFIQFQNGQGFVKNLGLRANLNFDSIINFLSQNGKTSVLSNPKLMALNNQQAIISVGDTINYQVKESSKGTENGTTVSESYNNYSIFVGILLNILPEISDDGKIMLRINPSLSDFKYPEDNKRQKEPRTIAPDTIQKKLSSVVQVENNQTLILGGLISHDKSNEKNSINFLSKIPILGSLFKGEVLNSKATEIVFIITPSIVDSVNAPSLKDLGFKIIPFREEIFHQINQILESQKAFIFLWGKSGSGKSVLLQRLAKKYNVDFINENFKDQSFLKEKIEFLISQGQSLIILDEVGMYDYAMLESIRIYSDSISFVLSSHKKLNILKKEHFKSRLSACFKLKNISLLELDDYIKLKFGMNFSNKCLKFLQKISQGNLRYIDKTLKSFYEINSFFDKNKSQEYILKLSALENGLLR